MKAKKKDLEEYNHTGSEVTNMLDMFYIRPHTGLWTDVHQESLCSQQSNPPFMCMISYYIAFIHNTIQS